jgi:toxin-antitoxin system PIN domain toxin
MRLIDVNVLIYAHRQDGPHYAQYKSWLETALDSPEALGVADLVLSAFLRIVTNPKAFRSPTPLAIGLDFVEAIRAHPNYVSVSPGPRHWPIFVRLCRETGASGNLIPDAYLAALAIESGSEWITSDRDYGQFAGLRWRQPF